MSVKKQFKTDTFYTWLYWILLLVLVGFCLLLESWTGSQMLFRDTANYEETGWLFGPKGGPLESVSLEEKRVFEPGQTYVLTTNLTYTGEGDRFPAAMISSGSLEIRAIYDGQETYSNTQAEKPFPKVQSVGFAMFPVNLGSSCAGKELTLELRIPMSHSEKWPLPQVRFGDHATQVRTLFISNLPSILISAAIVFAVLILILLGNTVDGTQWTYIYFAAFAVLVVVYRAMQDLFLVYVWGNPFMATLCEYFSMVAGPIPLLMSYRYRVKPYAAHAFHILIGLSILNLLTEAVLHFTGLLDVSDMLFANHVWLLVCAVSLTMIGLMAKKILGKRLIFRKLIPIILGALLDVVCYYAQRFYFHIGSIYSTGDFVGIGLLISLIMMIWEARQARAKAYQENERNKILERVAYTDALTGINNRAAFSRDIAAIEKGAITEGSLLVVSADLNGLKQTNDTYGHGAGDLLIQRGALALRDCLQPWGQVYRTGGDEFFAILKNVTPQQWEQIRQTLDCRIRVFNEGQKIPLSISVGHAFLEGSDMSRCIQLADERMYENKHRYHGE